MAVDTTCQSLPINIRIILNQETGYNYTDTDYVLLGIIIQSLLHEPLQKAYQQYLFSGLKNTYYMPNTYNKKFLINMAHGYDDEGTFGYNVDVTHVNTSFAATAGAIVSTPNNIVKFYPKAFSSQFL